jgi:hypothetical protein
LKKNSAVIPFPLQASSRKAPRPPKNLGKSGKTLWRQVQTEYGIQDAGGLAHLLQACRAEDDLVSWRERVSRDGAVVKDRFNQLKPHPLVAQIAVMEAVRRSALVALNLNVEPLHDSVGRPAGE